jgi:pyruvate dehydrogenase E2 component (dihydrolipoamide acetyltransferase)/2-oxoglutarate dehydrogenase E2 component (dihydrolipoamide succinyltransferase)
MEVPATEAGYVAALLAGEGEEVPVGEAVAILTDAPPAAPVRRTRNEAGAARPLAPPPAATPPALPAVKAEAPVPAARPAPPVAPAPLANGRILASPKARKLALDRGIDLAALVAAGVPQPFHVRDVEAFPAPAAAPASHRIIAETLQDGFTPFAAWAAETSGADATALLAGFAAASFRAATADARPVCIAVEGKGPARLYLDPDRALGRAEPASDAPPPALVLRDLRHSRITAVESGAVTAPVMTLGGRGGALTVTLVWADTRFAPDAALALADGFAARLEEPLRHLL